jgi:DNA polymerase-1
MYGMSPHTLYYTLMDFGVNLEDDELQKKYGAYSGQDLARTIYKRYFDSYKGVKDLIEKQKEFAREHEYVESIIGRKIWIPEINSSSRKYRGYGERLSTNGAVQSSASDVIMQAQVNLENSTELKNLGVDQLLQVHDKLLCCV